MLKVLRAVGSTQRARHDCTDLHHGPVGRRVIALEGSRHIDTFDVLHDDAVAPALMVAELYLNQIIIP